MIGPRFEARWSGKRSGYSTFRHLRPTGSRIYNCVQCRDCRSGSSCINPWLFYSGTSAWRWLCLWSWVRCEMPKLSPTVKHLVAEMRYEPSLAFYGVMDEIGLGFVEGYPDWQRSPLTLELRDKKRKRRCFLAFDRCFYESVGYGVEESELGQVRDLFAKVHHKLEFAKVRRFGLRRMMSFATTEDFPRMVRAVAKKFGPNSDYLDKALRGKLEDSGYFVNVRSDLGWRYHLRVGPMERKQWF